MLRTYICEYVCVLYVHLWPPGVGAPFLVEASEAGAPGAQKRRMIWGSSEAAVRNQPPLESESERAAWQHTGTCGFDTNALTVFEYRTRAAVFFSTTHCWDHSPAAPVEEPASAWSGKGESWCSAPRMVERSCSLLPWSCPGSHERSVTEPPFRSYLKGNAGRMACSTQHWINRLTFSKPFFLFQA